MSDGLHGLFSVGSHGLMLDDVTYDSDGHDGLLYLVSFFPVLCTVLSALPTASRTINLSIQIT